MADQAHLTAPRLPGRPAVVPARAVAGKTAQQEINADVGKGRRQHSHLNSTSEWLKLT